MSALSSGRFPRSGYVARSSSSGLADVLDVLLDKGLVIDIFLRVSLVGIELLTVDARIVIASVDTYLRYAEGTERLQWYNRGNEKGLPEMVGKQEAISKGGRLAEEGLETARDIFGSRRGRGRDRQREEEEDGAEEHEGVVGKLAKGVKKVVGKVAHAVVGGEEEDDDEQQETPRRRRDEERRERGGGGNGHGRPMRAAQRR